MARMAVNVVIDRRKTLDTGGRNWSVASILIHIIAVCGLLLGSVYLEHRDRSQPKVYRVSIATLSSAENANMSRTPNRPRTVEQAPVETKPKTEPPKQTEPKPKVKKPTPKTTEPKETVGINTSKESEKKPETKRPEPPPLEDAQRSGTGSSSKQVENARIGFGNQGSVFDLDQANFEYSYYLGLVQGKIGSNWVRNYIGRGKVKVYFRIGRSGKIVSAIIEQSSGDIGLDRMALQAVTESDPLPPLPEGYSGDILGIHIWFNYEE